MKNHRGEDRSKSRDIGKRTSRTTDEQVADDAVDLKQIDAGVALLSAYEMEFGELASSLGKLTIVGR